MSCGIHWFEKQDGRMREYSPFQPSFDQIVQCLFLFFVCLFVYLFVVVVVFFFVVVIFMSLAIHWFGIY